MPRVDTATETLTIKQAAATLRLSRNAAYAAARPGSGDRVSGPQWSP